MKRLANVVLATGAGICVLGAIGLASGAWVNLPPEAVRGIAMALPFAVGAALLTVGALIGRAARDERALRVPDGRETGAIGAGPAERPRHDARRQPDREAWDRGPRG